jgi:hypothetical protein
MSQDFFFSPNDKTALMKEMDVQTENTRVGALIELFQESWEHKTGPN